MKKIIILFGILISGVCLIYPTKVDSKTIYSESGILMNMDTKEVLVSKNEHKQYLTASIAKIMTCILAIEEKELDSIVVMTREDALQEGSKIYLKENEQVYLKDLLYGLMLRSGNDAAHAIAIHVSGSVPNFVKLMNQKAKSIGMKNSVFENPSGLDDSSENKSTAYDMALLMSYSANNPIYKEINNTKMHKFKSIDGNTYVFLNKHRLINKQTQYDGGKTGYTKKAGRTLVTSFTQDHVRLVVVTFKGSTDFNEHEGLFKYGYSVLTNNLYLKKQLFTYQNNYDLIYLYLKEDIYVKNRNLGVYTHSIIKKNEDFYLKVYCNEADFSEIKLDVVDFLDQSNQIFYDFIT